MTLAGPWGPEKSSTYIRVRVEFPPTYPTTAALSLSLERTAAMTEETKNEITSGILSIASSFVSRQRSSLEAIFRFLLGEQSLEESLLWLKKRQGSVDIDSTQDLDLSSSDEDDDGLGRYPGPQADNMETNDALIAESNAQYNVPLQKVCGALWADDGRLVCFFPLKQDKELSLLGLSLKGSDRSARSRRTIFEGFGRMHNEAGRQKRTASTLETIQSGDSDFDDASTSSSGTSTSSDHIGLPPHHFMPSMAWRGDISDIYQGIAVQSQRSSGDTGQAKSTMSRTNNCVTIHDFSNLLPARKILAQSYYILEGPKMCAHNARVANETGHIDLADVWSFVALILQDKVPLESKHFQRDSQPVFLRNSTSNLRTKGKASLPFHAEKEKLLTTPCSVNWSNHPFGRRWFVDSL